MKFSEAWLKEKTGVKITTEALQNQLTFAGLEVESCMPAAAKFDKVVVGEVISVKAHSNADKLRVCEVNIGKQTLTIVCGANNVKPGIKVPVALVGAVLPNDLEIKQGELRGVSSA